MKHLIQFNIAMGIAMITIIAAACSPTPTATPPPTPISPTNTPPPTATLLLTDTPTPEPTPTETPVPTPTIVKGAARICAILPDGTPVKGTYINVTDEDYAQVIPTDTSTGIKITSASGCRTVELPPGLYHVTGQKVVKVGEYISGVADFEVTLENTIEVKVELLN